MASIGFMQGRLSPLVNGKIQAFPWDHWREEFPAAQKLGLPMMEWTIDQERLYENPLMTEAGRSEIRSLCDAHGMSVPSLTGDCFMQAPFYKAQGAARAALLDDFKALANACAAVSVRYIVLPLVDNGHLDDRAQQDALMTGLRGLEPVLKDGGMKVIFESDLPPTALAAFIAEFSPDYYGINFDIGNSASLGNAPSEEIPAIGARIDNVHVKDRKRGGTTVPLGTGDADFETVFHLLHRANYRGNFILQTARAADGNHDAAVMRYRDMVLGWLAGAK